MILTEDKQVEALGSTEVEETVLDPPPTYSSLQLSSSSSLPKAVNYVCISRKHSSVKESFVIDPSLPVPLFFLQQHSSEEPEKRKNLSLECTHGQINTDVTIIGSTEGSKRVGLQMNAVHGGIITKIHGGRHRPPFHLQAQACNGNIRVYIPRTFCGPISISHRHGLVGFSDSINQNLTTFGEVESKRRCFLGDVSLYYNSNASEGWTGDELLLSVRHGNIKIYYEDDEVGSTVKTRPSTLLHRFFGF